jgi:hypothetical protein
VPFANLPELSELGVESYFFHQGKVQPVFIQSTLTPGTARLLADPKTRPRVVERLAEEIAEKYVAAASEELPTGPLRERIEEAIRARFDRPGQIVVNVCGLNPKPLAPKATVEIPEM